MWISSFLLLYLEIHLSPLVKITTKFPKIRIWCPSIAKVTSIFTISLDAIFDPSTPFFLLFSHVVILFRSYIAISCARLIRVEKFGRRGREKSYRTGRIFKVGFPGALIEPSRSLLDERGSEAARGPSGCSSIFEIHRHRRNVVRRGLDYHNKI